MRIGIKGDVHNNIPEFITEVNESDAELVLCVGDLGFYPDSKFVPTIDPVFYKSKKDIFQYDIDEDYFNKPVITIAGNHEDNEYLDDYEKNNGNTQFGNLIFLNKAFYFYKNIVIFGFGKIHADSTLNGFTSEEIDKYGMRENRKSAKTWIRRRNHFTKEDVKQASELIYNYNTEVRNWEEDIVIFLSHEAPVHLDPTKGYVVGSPVIKDLTELLSPDYAFFGHHDSEFVFNDTMKVIKENSFSMMEIK